VIVFKRSTDLDLIASMQLECFGKSVKYVQDKGEFCTWWVGYDGSRAVAFCGARVVDGHTLYLSLSGVLKCARGKRVQRRMVRLRERWARSQGLKHALTYTSATNYPSANTLIRCGYKLYAPEWAWAERKGWLYWQKSL
jgi:GNAT superfamily N-acetyltransferase